MILLALALLGFLLAFYVTMTAVVVVGLVLIAFLVAFFLLLAESEIPVVADTMNMFEFYSSIAVTGMSAGIVIGVALFAFAYVLGAYCVGVIAGLVAWRWRRSKT